MNSQEFLYIRRKLNKTQKQLAQLLGISIKAVHSYEQGWRSIPFHVERQMFFLASMLKDKKDILHPCWVVMNCPHDRRNKCPAWEFQAGKMCWFINGTICYGTVQKDWKEKMKVCRQCNMLISILN